MAGFRAAATELVAEFLASGGGGGPRPRRGRWGASGGAPGPPPPPPPPFPPPEEPAAAAAAVRGGRLPGGFSLDAWLTGRRAIECRVAEPDGRAWDDPLLPWRFVDQVDANFTGRLEQAAAAGGGGGRVVTTLFATDVTAARRLSRKLGRAARVAHRSFRARANSTPPPPAARPVTVALPLKPAPFFKPRPSGVGGGAGGGGSSGAVAAQVAAALPPLPLSPLVVTLRSGKTVVTVGLGLYEKLKALHAQAPASLGGGGGGGLCFSDGKAAARARDACFHERLVVLLLRETSAVHPASTAKQQHISGGDGGSSSGGSGGGSSSRGRGASGGGGGGGGGSGDRAADTAAALRFTATGSPLAQCSWFRGSVSLPPAALDALLRRLGCCVELFASPLSTR